MLRNLKTFSLPEIEEAVLKFWKEHDIFKKSLSKNEGKSKFIFYEGPPYANGRPGIHHILARSFKDAIPRYKTMQGFAVPRQAGWDTHGLPVEIEAEKELGIKTKNDIEKFGIAKFNAAAKSLVWKYRTEWEQLTLRMGFWVDLENPYITYENSYIESLWWIFSEINKKKLLYKGHRVVPWCPRCQTPLSSHELAQGYKETKDTSVYVKFKLKAGQKIGKFNTDDKTFILSWTTTPWTLPGNVALAVGEKIKYARVQIGETGEQYILAEELVGKVLTAGYYDEKEIYTGKQLVGVKYEPLFNIKALQNKKSHQIYPADFVTTTDGTGVVHTAVMYGEDDYALGVKVGLPQHHTVDETGRFTKEIKGFGGMVVKSKDPQDAKATEAQIITYLTENNLLLRSEVYTHEYPFCWRCSTPLIYYARDSWFIGMSKLRNELLKENEKINWTPKHIKGGRFGEWLREVKDWSISRNRYWGTPLPIWNCEKCQKPTVIAGLEDLDKYAPTHNKFFIVRHGEAESNLLGVNACKETKKDFFRMTDRGIKMAEALGEKIKKEKINLIVSSPYYRTTQTAKIVQKATKAKLIFDKRLVEIDAGEFNRQPVAVSNKIFANPAERFVKKAQGGETLTEVRARMIECVAELNRKYNGKNILIVSHGDPIWMLEGAMRGLTKPEEFLRYDFNPQFAQYHPLPVHNWPFDGEGRLDVHRPFIDEVKLNCPNCKPRRRLGRGSDLAPRASEKPMERIKDVADVWFDSGAMPFASVHYPFEHAKDLNFPADYISEAVDQTRGWFYTLLAIGTLLGRGTPYKNVICLGLVLDKNGQKMSKSKGNGVNPGEMMAKYGADAVRWYFYTINDPGDVKRFDEADLGKTMRRFILILYNSFVFWNSYGKRHETPKETYKPVNVLDRWILAELHKLIKVVTLKMDKYEVGEAGRQIELFMDNLSRWYIRRSRDRFQSSAKGEADDMKDWELASFTLQTVLMEISKLIAPFMPFFAEALYSSVGGKQESVHLDSWPSSNKEFIDEDLVENMEIVRKVAAEALALRAEVKIKVRQPLASLTLKNNALENEDELLELIKDEVNVKKILFDKNLKSEKGLELNTTITAELKEEGLVRELARATQGLRQDAGYQMGEEIILSIEGPDNFIDLVQRNAIQLKKAVTARQLEVKKPHTFDAEFRTKIDEWEVGIWVRKV